MKTTIFTKIILVFATLLLMTAIVPSSQTIAHAQSKMSAPVTGQNLRIAHFPCGRFEMVAPGSWVEYDRNSVHRYAFREVRRDGETVYLREDAIGVDLELNATRRIIMASWPGTARHQLYRMHRVEAEPRPRSPIIVTPVPEPPVRPLLPPKPPVITVAPNNLTKAVYKGGRFEKANTGTGLWTQFVHTGAVSTYTQIGYDEDAVYLYDRGRNVLVLLDTKRNMIRESRNGGVITDQYNATEMSATPTLTPRPERPSFALTTKQRMQCLASGGNVEKAGMLGAERCTLSYRDGGQICTDSSQCLGNCVAELAGANQDSASGICQRTDNPFGCYALVENGRTGSAICTD